MTAWYFSACIHATVCSVVTFTGVRRGTPVSIASVHWLECLPVVCCALLYAAVPSVVRLSVVWIMHHFP